MAGIERVGDGLDFVSTLSMEIILGVCLVYHLPSKGGVEDVKTSNL